MDEMQKTEAGTNMSVPCAAGAADMAGSTANAAAGAGDNLAGPAAAEEDQDGEGLLADEEPATDPALAKATEMELSEMASISIHTDQHTFADELKSTIYPSSYPLVVIECPTSRQTTFCSLLDRSIDIPAGSAYGLLIPLGYRDDLIGLLRCLLKKRFGSRGMRTVTLSVGKQTARIRP